MKLGRQSLVLLLLSILAVSASRASLLSQQYTASWIAQDFYPISTSRIYINNIQNETGHEASFDFLSYLKEQIYEHLSEESLKKASSGGMNVIHVDINVYLYQEGSTFGRWLSPGAGATYVVSHAIFHKNGQSIGAELLTVSVIAGGGLFSAGGEKSVLNDVAAVVASFLKEGIQK